MRTNTNYNYLEAVKNDIRTYLEYDRDIENEILNGDYTDADDLEQTLYDDLWIVDGVTGNASGSYTFNRNEAREYVLADTETVQEALKEFGVEAEKIADAFLNDDWEYLDVTARCYILGQALAEVLEEVAEEIEKTFEEYNNN